MKQARTKNHFSRHAASLLLLSVVCIGGTELFVCRFQDPQLFETITTPLVEAVTPVLQNGEDLLQSLQCSVRRSLSSLQPKAVEAQKLAANTPAILAVGKYKNTSVTELLKQKDGTKILTGGNLNLVYYNQKEEPWADHLYGSDPIARYGCGPTAMAILISSMTGSDTDPAKMADWAVQHNFWVAGSGSRPALIPKAAEAFGLKITSYSEFTPEAIQRELEKGNLFVALMTAGHFTQNGHFIILRGITDDGKILVADSNSTSRSLTVWDAQLILDELSPSRSGGAPLWLVSSEEKVA